MYIIVDALGRDKIISISIDPPFLPARVAHVVVVTPDFPAHYIHQGTPHLAKTPRDCHSQVSATGSESSTLEILAANFSTKTTTMSDVKIRQSSAPTPSTSPKRPMYPRFVTMPDLDAHVSGRAGKGHHRRRRCASTNPSSESSSKDVTMGETNDRINKEQTSCSSPTQKRSWSPRCSITDRLPLAVSRLLAETIDEPIYTPVEESLAPVAEKDRPTRPMLATSSLGCKSLVRRTCRSIFKRCSNLIAV